MRYESNTVTYERTDIPDGFSAQDKLHVAHFDTQGGRCDGESSVDYLPLRGECWQPAPESPCALLAVVCWPQSVILVRRVVVVNIPGRVVRLDANALEPLGDVVRVSRPLGQLECPFAVAAELVHVGVLRV